MKIGQTQRKHYFLIEGDFRLFVCLQAQVSVGLKDVFVVDTSDAVLIANNNCAETIKNV